jgi:uncharacterized membrane protein
MNSKPDKQFLDTVSRDTSYWRGPFYFNRRDPRLMVPKLYPSLGWTLNFANPRSYIAILALILVIIVCAFIRQY